ncbi:hypothetical protein SAMN04490243_2796 [Robiginitalea myxolifaciens]|uniref:UbiA prenyltransferase family protein n=1 Tax=Robiginitalea myxolifaciens TaxID=400055 RepID=A0A1I6HIL0_9FLAO|nr:hypothetical protein [Robiginitalea myxolifaciens]SFR54342.1 hypothetical protein SAMN04490243_2796 [Robiginitalea myxolifaciens]
MRALNGIFRFYIHGSFHVAFALLAFLFYSLELTGQSVPSAYVFTLFFGAVAGYNAIKWGAEPWKRRPSWPAPGKILMLSGICGVIALIAAMDLSLQFWLLLGLGTALAALYALPVFPGFRNLRSFGAIKVLIVALVWVHLTVWIPLWESKPLLNWDLQIEAIQRFLWVLLLMLPFEIRDMKADPAELRTWPRRWGEKTTQRLSWVGALLLFLLTFWKDYFTGAEVLSKALAAVLIVIAVGAAYRRKTAYLASFWVEAIPIICLAALLVLRWI